MARLAAPGADFVAAYCGMLVIGRAETARGGAAGPRSATCPRPDIAPVEGDILPSLMRASIVSTQTLVARRDRLLELGGFDEDMRALIDWDCCCAWRRSARSPASTSRWCCSASRPTASPATSRLRAAARARAVEKHLALLARHPALLADLHYMVARDAEAAGDPPPPAPRSPGRARSPRPAPSSGRGPRCSPPAARRPLASRRRRARPAGAQAAAGVPRRRAAAPPGRGRRRAAAGWRAAAPGATS